MKRITIFMALIMAVVLLAACAAPAGQPAPEAPAVTPTAEAPAPEPTPEVTPDPAPADVPSLLGEDYSVTFLGEDTAAADTAGGIGAAKAEALAAKVYGNELAGRQQVYVCEGLAQYQGETYYAINWTQMVEENGASQPFYMGHFYVSMDGTEVLEGDDDSVYPPIIGGG